MENQAAKAVLRGLRIHKFWLNFSAFVGQTHDTIPMEKSQAPKTLAQQIAELDDPAPQDIDPEEFAAVFKNRGGEGGEDNEDEVGEEDDGRGHYVDVGKSTLRKPDGPLLGPQYEGSKVSRNTLMALDVDSDDNVFGKGTKTDSEAEDDQDEEDIVDPEDTVMEGADIVDDEDIDSDEAFEEGDEEDFKAKGFVFRGSGYVRQADVSQHKGTNGTGKLAMGITTSSEEQAPSEDEESAGEEDSQDEPDSDNMSIGEDGENSEDKSSVESEPDISQMDDRAALRKLMAEEQKSVVATISQAAKADAAKGIAVKHQRSTFDALLNTRIRLQKALIATNSLSAVSNSSPAPVDSSIQAAEQAAIALWNSLNSLRDSLLPVTKTKKRPFSATISTLSSTIQASATSQEQQFRADRRSILTKWAQKTQLVSTLPTRNKLSNSAGLQPLTAILDAQLFPPNLDRLIQRTQLPRSCAPAQSQSAPATQDPTIFDDADFYTLLLRDLVDQKMSATAPTTPHLNGTATATTLPSLAREAKTRKQVDTKASKGRKIRYTVHEKLQNFMAPEDRGSWGERQIDELFAGLLGRRLGLEEGDQGDERSEGEVEAEGLRLFGGV